ncbi:MAG: GH92 family glycosyl hydrolase [Bacteroidia bacterium]
MRKFPFLLLLLIACQPTSQIANNPNDILSFVDPFVGTGGHGHTIPGASVPFGMVQLSPDTHLDGWDASGGYHYDDEQIYGFSHTHLSGTGIGDMGDILVLPYRGEIPVETQNLASLQGTFDHKNESASPGYYQVLLDNYKVNCELTASTRVGMHRYTFQGSQTPKIMLDLGHILQANWGHKSIYSELEIIDDRTIRGMRISSGWAFDHPVYFYARFSERFEVEGIMEVDNLNTEGGNQFQSPDLKAFLAFPEGKEILLKVGISGVSEAGAQANLDAEITDWDFEKVRQAAAQKWREQLSILEIKSTDEKVMKNFYTSLYHCMFAPQVFQDVDGQYRGMDKEIHQAAPGFTNYTVFSLWDTFRAWHPLMTIVDPDRAGNLAQSLVQKYTDGGVLPKWPLAANYTGTMVGYPAVSVLADAMAKNLPGLDHDKALEAAVFSSQYHPEVIAKIQEPRAAQLMPKHLDFIERLGFVPGDSISGSVSYGLECAYYDWCIAEMARKLGRTDIETTYLRRSQYYKKYLDPKTGFMRGKNGDGSWKTPFSPYFSDHELGDYIEGNAWQWSWFVPHEVEGLAEGMGGKAAFGSKLDSLFTADSKVEGENASGDISGLIGQYAHGNEPSHHIAYLYHWAGQPEKTQLYLDRILQTLYEPTPDGISGNEDCGAMSAWYVLNAMGFYQVCPGDPTYRIGRPLIDEVSISLPGDKAFRITVQNNAPNHPYIASASLNGEILEDLSFTHRQLMAGGELKILMRE